MNGGDDTFSAPPAISPTLIGLTVDGGAGNDTITGGNGADALLGGDGNDFIDGRQGNDVALLGAGNDVFQWDPGRRQRHRRGPGWHRHAAVQRLQGRRDHRASRPTADGCASPATSPTSRWTQRRRAIEINALGGADTITVGDLSGTDAKQVEIDLAATVGGGHGPADQ